MTVMNADWKEVSTLDELNAFLDLVGGFHDGIVKEVHWLNRDHVWEDLKMLPYRLSSVRMLVQRQWKNPSAVEMMFDDVYRLHLDWQFVFASEASTETAPPGFGWDDRTLLVLKMELNEVAFGSMRWRDASEWMGPEPRFGA